jgi:hypothetical protein
MPISLTTPPPALVDAVGRLRAGFGTLHRRLVPSNVALLELTQGAWVTQALYAAVRLRFADALADGPLHADEVAHRTGADADATFRVLRALAGQGVFTLRRDGRFALTRVGRTLRWDAEGSMAPMIAMVGSEEHWQHWSDLEHSVRTGRTAVEKQRGVPIFEYLETNPAYAARFNAAMTGVSAMAIQAAVPAYDFTGRRLVVDVGGGHGALLTAVLGAAPAAEGILFDLPSVAEGAREAVAAAGLTQRCAVTGGSFFESVPAGGDMYLMKTVIHDWDDDRAREILRSVRTAIAPDGTLLLFELVLPGGAPPHPGLLLDLEMLVHAGGRERTAAEYSELLAQSGFRQTRVIPTGGPMSIVEAVPA